MTYTEVDIYRRLSVAEGTIRSGVSALFAATEEVRQERRVSGGPDEITGWTLVMRGEGGLDVEVIIDASGDTYVRTFVGCEKYEKPVGSAARKVADRAFSMLCNKYGNTTCGVRK